MTIVTLFTPSLEHPACRVIPPVRRQSIEGGIEENSELGNEISILLPLGRVTLGRKVI